MSDSEEIVTNAAGGKQSKLYSAYHLIDPWALQALSAIHHRGSIKYSPDNWRKIPTEEHLNHAMHHIVDAMKRLSNRRLGVPDYNFAEEDSLSHALCRITFAVAMETRRYGLHPEHSDPRYHEAKATPTEPGTVRVDEGGLRPVPPAEGFNEGARGFATLVNTPRRYPSKRASSALRSSQLGIGKTPVRRGRGRR